MHTVQNIFIFIVTILILVTVHELGHYWVGRCFGIRALRFSIGFGKPIWRKMCKSGMELRVCILPLGGYVKFLDEDETPIPSELRQYAYSSKPVWQRMLVVAAGPVTNFILAILMFWLLFAIGIQVIKPVIGKVQPDSIAANADLQEDSEIVAIDGKKVRNWQQIMINISRRLGDDTPMTMSTLKPNSSKINKHLLDLSTWQVDGLNPAPLQSLGIAPYHPDPEVVLEKVILNGPAAKAGLQAGDKIVSIDDKPLKGWNELVDYVSSRPDENVTLGVQRDHKIFNLDMKLGRKLNGRDWRGWIGVEVKPVPWPASMRREINYSLLGALKPALQEVYTLTTFNFVVLGKLIVGKISLRALGGPITIYNASGQAFHQGFLIYLAFLGLVNVLLAFFNILPIPGLDGGHFIFLIFESLKQRPLSIRMQSLVLRIGYTVLFVIVAQAIINDMLRLFG